MRTTDGVSKAIKAEQVLASIIMFGFVYFLLGILWLFLLNRKIQAGPHDAIVSGDDSIDGDNSISDAVSGGHHLTGDN